MTDMEVANAEPAWFSREDGKPTLWDHEYDGGVTQPREGWVRAVVLTSTSGDVEIHTNPEIVAAYLDVGVTD